MVAESFCQNHQNDVEEEEKKVVEAPFILGLQPSALVDNVAHVDLSLLDRIPGERGGSIPVAIEELEHILREVKSNSNSSDDDNSHSSSVMKTMAGGSVANTIRGLSSGFGISSGIIGACGDDEQGQLFVNNMSSNGVDLSRLRKKKGHTAQ
ncbi:pfkB family carbohydrate kinase, partial [Trifolium pratense]